MKNGIGLIGVVAGLLFAGSAFAVPINTDTGNEPSLFEIAAGNNAQNTTLISGLDNNSTQANNAYWKTGGIGTSNAKLFATWTGNYADATFGIYDPSNTNSMLTLLTGGTQIGSTPVYENSVEGTLRMRRPGEYTATQFSDGEQVAQQKAQFGSEVFGFFLTIGGNTFYSDPTLNGGMTRVVGYEGDNSGTFLPNEYLLGWEEGDDGDYQDYVLGIESVRPVPEPASLAMFGLGLLFVGFAARRGQKKS